MSVIETNEPDEAEKAPVPDEAEFIRRGFEAVKGILTEQFPDYIVDGHIGQHPLHGPILAFTLVAEGKAYTCGFFLNELARQFQTNPHVAMWLSSFFVDLLGSPEGKLLPKPPQSEEETKELFDKIIIPLCIQAIQEEFAPEPIHVDLGLNPEIGPVLEASFSRITEGNNTCAIPLHYLLALYLMNRDPAEPFTQALLVIKPA